MQAPPLKDVMRGEVFFVSQLKALMEKYGVYHDVTGRQINRLLKERVRLGFETIFGVKHFYIYDNALASDELSNLLKEKRELYSRFVGIIMDNRYSGFFAEAIIFLALCKAFSLYGSSIGMHILQPEQRWIDGVAYKIEFPIAISGEVFAFEVKNNFMQLSPKSKSVQKLLSLDPSLNPVLINRQSTVKLKSQIMRSNGRVVDLTRLLLLQNEDSDVFSDLGIDHIVTFIQQLQIGGSNYNGTTFKERVQQFEMNDLVQASVQVPTWVQAKVNGLIVLLHLATRFRQAKSFLKGRKAISMCSALLAQHAYSYLLGAQGQPRDFDDCFSYATSKIFGTLARYISKDQAIMKEELSRRLEDLRAKQFLERKGSTFWVKDFSLPENWLKRDP